MLAKPQRQQRLPKGLADIFVNDVLHDVKHLFLVRQIFVVCRRVGENGIANKEVFIIFIIIQRELVREVEVEIAARRDDDDDVRRKVSHDFAMQAVPFGEIDPVLHVAHPHQRLRDRRAYRGHTIRRDGGELRFFGWVRGEVFGAGAGVRDRDYAVDIAVNKAGVLARGARPAGRGLAKRRLAGRGGGRDGSA